MGAKLDACCTIGVRKERLCRDGKEIIRQVGRTSAPRYFHQCDEGGGEEALPPLLETPARPSSHRSPSATNEVPKHTLPFLSRSQTWSLYTVS